MGAWTPSTRMLAAIRSHMSVCTVKYGLSSKAVSHAHVRFTGPPSTPNRRRRSCVRRRFDVSARCHAAHQLYPVSRGSACCQIFANDACRNGGTWLGQLRCDRGVGRRVCRSSELRHGGDRARARRPRISCGHHRATGVDQRGAVQSAGQTESLLGRDQRQHGFHDQPLHG